MSALEVISRGVDSSGRAVRGTRQMFQYYDRVNEQAAGGNLVIVQGSFMGSAGASKSAGTHNRAGCQDWRTWNLTLAVRTEVIRVGSALGGAPYFRGAPSFDDHIHTLLLGDAPMDPDALFQVSEYKAGRNGLVNRGPDPHLALRPNIKRDYIYLEDDMFNEADRRRMIRIEKAMEAEKTRDQREAARDKRRFQALVAARGRDADAIGVLINRTTDVATKTALKRVRADILKGLKDDPDVTKQDNPSDEAMENLT